MNRKPVRRISPQELAAGMVRFGGPDGRPPSPEAVRAQYQKNAAQMRDVAARAAASKSGKCRGYTPEKASELAHLHESYSELVPAEMRRLVVEAA